MVFSFDISDYKYECEEVKSLMVAELEFDILTEKAFKDYFFESGLKYINESYGIDMKGDTSSKPESNNPIVKLLKTIWSGISKLFSAMRDSISGLFKDNMDIKDYVQSGEGREKFEADVARINDEIDDDLRKGCKLLQMVSSKTGLPDELLSEWILNATEHVEKVAPCMISAGIVKFLKPKIKASLNGSVSKDMQNAFEEATKKAETETDPAKKAQYQKIAAQLQKSCAAKSKFTSKVVKAAKAVASTTKHVFTTDVSELSKEAKEASAKKKEERAQKKAEKQAREVPDGKGKKAVSAVGKAGKFVGDSFKHVVGDTVGGVFKKKKDDSNAN